MIEPVNPELSIGKQCRLLSVSRSSFYYTPKGETALNLMLMRQIDEQFLETPFFGARQMTWHLRNEGHLLNEKRIRRLMRLMGLMPIYQKPNTSKAAKGHKIYPYLLRTLLVDLPARLGERIRGQGRCRKVDGALQPQTSPLRTWRQTHSRGLLAEKRRNQIGVEGGMIGQIRCDPKRPDVKRLPVSIVANVFKVHPIWGERAGHAQQLVSLLSSVFRD
jgi:hypothetical protein